MIVPHDGDVWTEPLFAGCHRLNGNGELTGPRVDPRGGPARPVRSGSRTPTRRRRPRRPHRQRRRASAVRDVGLWSLPVVGETWDGLLNDIDGFHVTADHVDDGARDGARRRRRRGQRRRRDRDGLPRVQGRDRDGVAGRRRRGGRLDGRRPRPGELRPARPAPGRRRPGRRGDPGRRTSRARTPRTRTTTDRRPGPRRRAGLGLDHRHRRDRRAAPAPPVRAARPAGGSRARAHGRHRGPLERRPLPLLRDRQPDAAADVVPSRTRGS